MKKVLIGACILALASMFLGSIGLYENGDFFSLFKNGLGFVNALTSYYQTWWNFMTKPIQSIGNFFGNAWDWFTDMIGNLDGFIGPAGSGPAGGR